MKILFRLALLFLVGNFAMSASPARAQQIAVERFGLYVLAAWIAPEREPAE